MQLRTLIFDFDGTIADSFDATWRIANELAPEFGYRAAHEDEIELLRSSGYREIAARLGVAWHKIPMIVARIRKELSRTMSSMATFEGVPGVLSELRARGKKLGILTSNERANVERFLIERELNHFDFIGSSASLWGKERRLRSLLRSHRLNVHECAYVGDEVRDIQATKPLGMCMIAVAWGYTGASNLAEHGPDYLIRRPSELLEIPRLSQVSNRS